MIGETGRTEEELLGFIDSYWAQFWTSPSYQQIGLFLGVSSRASVHYHLNKLVERGLLEKKDQPDPHRKVLYRRRIS